MIKLFLLSLQSSFRLMFLNQTSLFSEPQYYHERKGCSMDIGLCFADDVSAFDFLDEV